MNNRMQKIIGAVGFASAFFTLIACGDSNTTETVVEKGATDIVASVADLPKCTAQNEGEQIFVKEDGLIRFCSDGKWYAVAGGENASCSTEALKDSSGIKIICNGDSVGVVLNGAKGDRGEQGIQGETGEKGEAGADGKDGSVAAGCTVETLADDSGLKVICGGDSVGVVLNGKDGEQGEKGEPGKDGADGKDGLAGEGSTSSCALVTKDCIVHVACDKDTVSLDVISKEDACNEIAILDSEQVAISLDSVKGASQKGPFLSGSKVLVKELLDGRTLSQTGNNFDGKILNDKGEFKITARMLVSQYVMLEATGYYRNEVTGQNSSSPLTLFGITDVTTRNIVNINLLTHLEYERVIYLVTKKKMKVLDAKKQAQQEIFNILRIDNSNFSNSEDLSIAGSSDEDGALLAFSILFQGDRSVSQLTELLTRISTAMEKEGKWDDATTKAEIADWAMAADTSGRLADIRGKVDAWNLGSMVPKFEPYVRNFWRVEHGLGLCGDSVKVGTVVKPTRGKTDANIRFICAETDDGDIRWRIATDIEKDTYEWAAGKDGEVKKGDVTDTHYLYNGVKKEWNKASMIETALLMGCVESRKGTFHKVNGEWFICENRSWESTKNIIVDTDGWIPGSDGDVKKGDNTGDYYVFDEIEGNWRTASDNEVNLNLKGCTTKRTGVMSLASSGDYYICQNVEQCEYNWNTGESVCTTHHWSLVENDVAYNTYGYVCDEEGKMVLGKVHTTSYFVCDGSAWRKATNTEEHLKLACTSGLQGNINEVVNLTCGESDWRKTNFFDYPVGTDFSNPKVQYETFKDIRDGHEYKTVKIGVQTWFAQNLNYADSVANPYLKGQTGCYNDMDENCLKGGRYYSWTAAVNIDRKWQSAKLPEDMISERHQGICPEGWILPDSADFALLYELAGGSIYDLQAVGNVDWPAATNVTGFSALPGEGYDVGKCCSDDEIANFDFAAYWTASESYSFDHTYGAWTFDLRSDRMNFNESFGYGTNIKDRKFPIRCMKYNTVCEIEDEGKMTRYGPSAAYCHKGRWLAPTEMDYDLAGELCNENFKVVLGTKNTSNIYVCYNGIWYKDEKYVWRVDHRDEFLNPEIEYGEFVDSRDQQSYKTIIMGTQQWMAQNLRYADSIQSPYLKSNIKCAQDNPAQCDITGVLYSWTATMNIGDGYKNRIASGITLPYQGICPEGWHVPSQAEMIQLLEFVGKKAAALSVNTGGFTSATNSSGFSLLPAGDYVYHTGNVATLWLANEFSAKKALNLFLSEWEFENPDSFIEDGSKNDYRALRCVKDL